LLTQFVLEPTKIACNINLNKMLFSNQDITEKHKTRHIQPGEISWDLNTFYKEGEYPSTNEHTHEI
jgi:hypothetical protein